MGRFGTHLSRIAFSVFAISTLCSIISLHAASEALLADAAEKMDRAAILARSSFSAASASGAPD